MVAVLDELLDEKPAFRGFSILLSPNVAKAPIVVTERTTIRMAEDLKTIRDMEELVFNYKAN
jgi:hypothetical protein